MNHVIRMLVVFLAVSSPVFSKNTPHLLLYFDINETLIASDKAGDKSVDDILNELLAKKYKAYWDASLKEPISFENYTHDVLVPGSKNNPQFREQANACLHHFIDYLKKSCHPLYNSVYSEYLEVSTRLKSSPRIVFASFYHLIDYLDQEKIPYTIVLRSFGFDIEDVKEEISDVYQVTFPQTGRFHEGSLNFDGHGSISEAAQIYENLKNRKHIAVQDDYKYWNNHAKDARYGKPFYINREDQEVLSIFFDDNINLSHTSTNIIGPLDVVTGEFISIEELVESGQVVRVNTLQAIIDIDYYKKLVKEALEKQASSMVP